jgi:phage recombination protein Bet
MVLAFTDDQKQLIKNTVAKGATDDELALFLHLAQTYGLDPFAKEIFCMKYGNQAATIITGRDGYLKIANGRQEMDGIQSDSVCKNDTLTKNTDGTVNHTYGTPERGPVIGAYALVFRKDRSRAAYFYAPMAEYNAGSNPTWKKYPTAMIIKVAEACALKRAFSISGLVTQEEMDVSQEGQRSVVQAQQEAEATYAEVLPDVRPFEAAQEPIEANPKVQYATASQKEEIIRLLNHPVITRPEKTKMLLNINRLDEERAVQAIAKLRKAIDDRENGEKAAA